MVVLQFKSNIQLHGYLMALTAVSFPAIRLLPYIKVIFLDFYRADQSIAAVSRIDWNCDRLRWVNLNLVSDLVCRPVATEAARCSR